MIQSTFASNIIDYRVVGFSTIEHSHHGSSLDCDLNTIQCDFKNDRKPRVVVNA